MCVDFLATDRCEKVLFVWLNDTIKIAAGKCGNTLNLNDSWNHFDAILMNGSRPFLFAF